MQAKNGRGRCGADCVKSTKKLVFSKIFRSRRVPDTLKASEMMDELATIGKLLTIHGFGLKIEADDAHKDAVGLFFDSEIGYPPVKADIIAVNQPRTLKVIVPAGLKEGSPYKLRVVTQGSTKGHGYFLKAARDMRSDFTLTAQA